jgi:hypothetical protein
MNSLDDSNTELPPWFEPVSPCIDQQESLFKLSLETALAREKVSPDELNRWHAQRWISFAFVPMELNDPDDQKILELVFVRDVVRSGLSDAQITQLLADCPKPHSFDPDRTAFSFRYGLVQAVPPVEPEEPATVIETNLDDWIQECDKDRLTQLRDQILERLKEIGDTEADEKDRL